MTDTDENRELRSLDTDECYRLIATQQLGRVGVIIKHYPLIFPVNYGMDQQTIVLRMDAGTLLAAVNHANVSFQVDQIDQSSRTGWCVLVRGLAEEVTPAHRSELVQRTLARHVQPWAPGERGHWVRLIPHAISGRRIVPGELPAAFEPNAYL